MPRGDSCRENGGRHEGYRRGEMHARCSASSSYFGWRPPFVDASSSTSRTVTHGAIQAGGLVGENGGCEWAVRVREICWESCRGGLGCLAVWLLGCRSARVCSTGRPHRHARQSEAVKRRTSACGHCERGGMCGADATVETSQCAYYYDSSVVELCGCVEPEGWYMLCLLGTICLQQLEHTVSSCRRQRPTGCVTMRFAHALRITHVEASHSRPWPLRRLRA